MKSAAGRRASIPSDECHPCAALTDRLVLNILYLDVHLCFDTSFLFKGAFNFSLGNNYMAYRSDFFWPRLA
jgi:hypothetical protein